MKKRKLKRSVVFFIITLFLFVFLIKLDQILINDKSNYYLPYKELNYLVEYCKIKDKRILEYFDNYTIEGNKVIAQKEKKKYYIKCS
jgi:hypothetical protein